MQAFQKAKDEFVETLREGLKNTEEIFKKVLGEVALNADVIGDTINETAQKDGITLSESLTSPWIAAGIEATQLKDNAGTALNDMISEDGVITIWSDSASTLLSKPFLDATIAETGPIAKFKSASEGAIDDVKAKVNGEDGNSGYLGNGLSQPWEDATKEDGPIATFSKDAQKAIEDAQKKVNGEDGNSNYIGDGLTDPWKNAVAEGSPINTFDDEVGKILAEAKDKVTGKEGEDDYLGNSLTKPWEDALAEDGPIATFDDDVAEILDIVHDKVAGTEDTDGYLGNELDKPWETDAPNTFAGTVSDALQDIIDTAKEKIPQINAELSKIKYPDPPSYTGTDIGDTGDTGDDDSDDSSTKKKKTSGSGYNNGSLTADQVKELQEYLGVSVDGKWGNNSQNEANNQWGVTSANDAWSQYQATHNKWTSYQDAAQSGFSNIRTSSEFARAGNDDKEKYKTYQRYLDAMYAKYGNEDLEKFKRLNPTTQTPMVYAKGTLGTKRDEWAITDESWIGEEITLAAGKNGQLQYLKKGSAVMPADISANLVEWGKLNPNMLNMTHQTAGVNMISNAINKPELNISFDSLVHVDNCSQDTLKDLEKMVDNKIGQFSKQLNYSVKKFAR